MIPGTNQSDTRLQDLDQLCLHLQPWWFSESSGRDAGMSDHLMVFAIRMGGQSHGHRTKKVRAFKRCNVDALLDDLQCASRETTHKQVA